MSDRVSRRDLLKYTAAGLAGAGLAKGLDHFGPRFLSARQPGSDAPKLAEMHEKLGRWLYLAPQKLGGGTHVVDLGSNKTLAWISYWNYGDTCPISHHLAAYPSPDPYKGFEFVNSTQGGDNVMIYGLPTQIKKLGLLEPLYGQGNRIYRVQFDGTQMNLVEDISETTGIGLGVHTTIFPDAAGFACADGQKDICAFFDRPRGSDRTKTLMAFRGDWVPTNKSSLERNWRDGGTLRFQRLTEPRETGKFDLQGSKGNKINWEMVPMAENLVEKGMIPGDNPRGLTGLDGVVHHPGNRYSAVILRMLGSALILDRKNWEPVCILHSPEGSPDNIPVKKVASGPDTWEAEFKDIKCVAHECGFSPSGKNFTLMANIQQNYMPVWDTSDEDPRKWKRVAGVKDPSWKGEYPSPFHVAFSMDGSKMFVSVLHPKPANSEVVVVDTKTWKIIKKFKNVGPDCQTMAVTYDGKYVFQIFSGFQRMSSGLFIFTQDTLEPVGYQPNFGGHHDCVIVPTKVEHLANSRCCTV